MVSENFAGYKHGFGINSFHLEWCTKYRKKVLEGNLLKQVLSDSIKKTASEYGMNIIAMEIGLDHIHIFVSLPASMAVSKALNLLKGRSSREIFVACPSFKKYLFYSGHFWSRGIFYRSVSNVSSDAIYNYIKNHKNKELQNSVVHARNEAEQLSLLSFF